ncbi:MULTISPECIES: PepSY-like domain-containing protein [unclassified Campylobacter]|uniref:PepSY-like domain-containing protein n=1 Tax=unclassified Campylobacter TaxID=2593542 RepID=UPI0021AEBEE4|nr:PepSY-like domain-containing protein [Campylobacter sp. MIT 12-8780]
MFKKFVLAFFFLCLLAKADLIISPDSLPENTKQFLSTNFKAQVGMAQRDGNSFEVYLTDGTELEFDIMGNWKEISSKFTPINFSILPANIAAIIQNQFPNTFLLEAERKINYYKIKLSNRLELKIDANGTILSQEFDD